MAIKSLVSSHLFVNQSDSFRKPVFGVVVLRKNKLHVKKQVTIQIKSSLKNQVFEDHSNGIICYENENGEIICEGFDEGPRIHPSQCPIFPSPSKELSVHDLLKKRWLQILDDKIANGSSTLIEEQPCNGFNTLH